MRPRVPEAIVLSALLAHAAGAPGQAVLPESGVAPEATSRPGPGTSLESAASSESGVSAVTAETQAALFTPEELEFLQHMIVHHEQALEMAALVPERTRRDDLVRFARYVAGAQAAEIAWMKSLLELAADRGIGVPAVHHHDDPPMAGMLSRAQINALASARGAGFERLWLEGMIHHHEGALAMARAQQQRQFRAGRRPYMIDVLVEHILVEQRAEIARMRQWLADWGVTDGTVQSPAR